MDSKQPIIDYYKLSPSVIAFNTTRYGGTSCGAYGEFNIMNVRKLPISRFYV